MSETQFFDVLPVRIQLYEGECLSGYLLRLAAANGVIDFRAFVQSLFPAWHNRREVHVLRWEYPVDSWGALPLRTQLPIERLARMTLLPWVAKFRTPSIRIDIRQLSPGQILRGLVHPTLQVCPLCLQEEKPYQQLLWRLQPVVTCLE
ncbi:MAG: TniQ family protein, partial [Anaerolineales bacterium]|nr:TniQ family protein [Anaerolineales bacterium]